MKRPIQDLKEALWQLEKEGIQKLELIETPPDNQIKIFSKKHLLVVGANELGFWLEKFEEV